MTKKAPKLRAEFETTVSPSSSLTVKVAIHPSVGALAQADGDPTCAAFFQPVTAAHTAETGSVGSLHFSPQVPLDILAHECQHAALAFASFCRLDLANGDAEELLAYSTGHLMEKVRAGLRKAGIRVR